MAHRTGAIDEFSKLHQLFITHFGTATVLAWVTSLYAAAGAPWVRNIHLLIDPTRPHKAESTVSFLIAFPMLMTLALTVCVFGRETLRAGSLLKSPASEFALAGAVAFVMFYMTIDRAVTALTLG